MTFFSIRDATADDCEDIMGLINVSIKAGDPGAYPEFLFRRGRRPLEVEEGRQPYTFFRLK